MASNIKKIGDHHPEQIPNRPEGRFGIVVSEYHSEITSALYQAATDTLLKYQVKAENIYTSYVPGAYELPLGCLLLNKQHDLDAVIALGCVIKGETDHDKYINQAVATGIMNLNLHYNMPFVFGLLTPNTYEQAKDRAGGKLGNKGTECAITALKML